MTTAKLRNKPSQRTLPAIPGAPSVKPEGSRAKAVEAARQAFFEQGFHGTPIADVLARAEINAGSLYYHFKTKDEILGAVLRGYLDMLEPFVMAPAMAASPTDSIARIFALLDGYRAQLVGSGFRLGCPVGSLAIEIAATHPEARALVVENFAAWQSHVRAWIMEAQSEGRLSSSALPDALASFVLVTMEGAMVVAKARQSTEPWDQAVACLRSVFGGLGWTQETSSTKVLLPSKGPRRVATSTKPKASKRTKSPESLSDMNSSTDSQSPPRNQQSTKQRKPQ